MQTERTRTYMVIFPVNNGKNRTSLCATMKPKVGNAHVNGGTEFRTRFAYTVKCPVNNGKKTSSRLATVERRAVNAHVNVDTESRPESLTLSNVL